MNTLGQKFIGIVLAAVTLFLAASLVSFTGANAHNLAGPVGTFCAALLLDQFGLASFFLFFPLSFGVCHCFIGTKPDQIFLRALGVCLVLFGLAGLSGMAGRQLAVWGIGLPGTEIGPGGWLGASEIWLLDGVIHRAGSVVLLFSVLLAGLILCADRTLLWMLGRLKWTKTRAEQSSSDLHSESPVEEIDENSPGLTSLRENQPQINAARPSRMALQAARGRTLEIATANDTEEFAVEESVTRQEDYQLPSNELLTPPEIYDQDIHLDTVQRQAIALEEAFSNFKLQVEVVDIQTGPVISQFELRLAKGLRLNKIQALSDDLAIALKVSSVRIVAPIPGKNTVGVELPNEHRQMVRLRDVMEQRPDAVEKMAVPIYLGKDVSGNPMVIDLTKLPHLLIAGRTGTGKSVCLNSIIVSMLMTRSPIQVRMLMVDPKMVELTPYKTIPHLMHPVVTDMRKAEAILGWAVEKMEERYQLLAAAGVRQLSEYNNLPENELRRRMGMEGCTFEEWDMIPKSMPYLVIIADEMADLMMTAAKEVETHIIRLAQKSRAVGIHLVLATQKPTVDIVTGLIKSNLPARIAFGVATRTDSQVVLDRVGAERLLGNGDMLFLQPNTGLTVRGQGTFVSDSEIESIIEEIGTDAPDFAEELIALDPDADPQTAGTAGVDTRDELYHEAVEYIIQEGRGSLSLLQRRFSIGYGRAARLIDFMAEDGVVGPHNGAQPREVVMTLADWRRRANSGGAIQPAVQVTEKALTSQASPKANSNRRGIPLRPVIQPEEDEDDENDYYEVLEDDS